MVEDPRLGHLLIEIAALPGALADPGEYRHATVELGDVVDQFHDNDGLAHAGPAKRADLAALQERTDQINDLDAGGQHLWRSRLVHEGGRRAVDRIVFLRRDRSALIHRVTADIEDSNHLASIHRLIPVSCWINCWRAGRRQSPGVPG